MAGGPPFLLLVFARRSDGGLERVAEQGSTGSAVKATLKPMTRRRLQLWLVVVTDPQTGKRRRTTYRLTVEEARARYVDPEPVPNSREMLSQCDDGVSR